MDLTEDMLDAVMTKVDSNYYNDYGDSSESDDENFDKCDDYDDDDDDDECGADANSDLSINVDLKVEENKINLLTNIDDAVLSKCKENDIKKEKKPTVEIDACSSKVGSHGTNSSPSDHSNSKEEKSVVKSAAVTLSSSELNCAIPVSNHCKNNDSVGSESDDANFNSSNEEGIKKEGKNLHEEYINGIFESVCVGNLNCSDMNLNHQKKIDHEERGENTSVCAGKLKDNDLNLNFKEDKSFQEGRKNIDVLNPSISNFELKNDDSSSNHCKKSDEEKDKNIDGKDYEDYNRKFHLYDTPPLFNEDISVSNDTNQIKTVENSTHSNVVENSVDNEKRTPKIPDFFDDCDDVNSADEDSLCIDLKTTPLCVDGMKMNKSFVDSKSILKSNLSNNLKSLITNNYSFVKSSSTKIQSNFFGEKEELKPLKIVENPKKDSFSELKNSAVKVGKNRTINMYDNINDSDLKADSSLCKLPNENKLTLYNESDTAVSVVFKLLCETCISSQKEDISVKGQTINYLTVEKKNCEVCEGSNQAKGGKKSINLRKSPGGNSASTKKKLPHLTVCTNVDDTINCVVKKYSANDSDPEENSEEQIGCIPRNTLSKNREISQPNSVTPKTLKNKNNAKTTILNSITTKNGSTLNFSTNLNSLRSILPKSGQFLAEEPTPEMPLDINHLKSIIPKSNHIAIDDSTSKSGNSMNSSSIGKQIKIIFVPKKRPLSLKTKIDKSGVDSNQMPTTKIEMVSVSEENSSSPSDLLPEPHVSQLLTRTSSSNALSSSSSQEALLSPPLPFSNVDSPIFVSSSASSVIHSPTSKSVTLLTPSHSFIKLSSSCSLNSQVVIPKPSEKFLLTSSMKQTKKDENITLLNPVNILSDGNEAVALSNPAESSIYFSCDTKEKELIPDSSQLQDEELKKLVLNSTLLPPFTPPISESVYDSSTLKFKCPECPDVFMSKESLRNHLNRRSALLMYDCPNCTSNPVTTLNKCMAKLHCRNHKTELDLNLLTIELLPYSMIDLSYLIQPSINLLSDNSVSCKNPKKSNHHLGHSVLPGSEAKRKNLQSGGYHVKPLTQLSNPKSSFSLKSSSNCPSLADSKSGATPKNCLKRKNTAETSQENKVKNPKKCKPSVSNNSYVKKSIENPNANEANIEKPSIQTTTTSSDPTVSCSLEKVGNKTDLMSNPNSEKHFDQAVICPECSKVCNSLVNHFQSDEKSGSSCICECKKMCPTACSLKAHIRLHRKEPPYTCPECGKTFSDSELLNKHFQKSCFHPFKKISFECIKCHQNFTALEKLKSHMFMYHMEKVYICSHCSESNQSLSDMNEHVRTVHAKFSNPSTYNILRFMKCEFCKDNLFPRHQSNLHVQSHIKSQSNFVMTSFFSCSYCLDFKTFSKLDFSQHIDLCSFSTSLENGNEEVTNTNLKSPESCKKSPEELNESMKEKKFELTSFDPHEACSSTPTAPCLEKVESDIQDTEIKKVNSENKTCAKECMKTNALGIISNGDLNGFESIDDIMMNISNSSAEMQSKINEVNNICEQFSEPLSCIKCKHCLKVCETKEIGAHLLTEHSNLLPDLEKLKKTKRLKLFENPASIIDLFNFATQTVSPEKNLADAENLDCDMTSPKDVAETSMEDDSNASLSNECSKCSFKGSTYSDLFKHMEAHKTTYTCSQCNECFVVLPSLEKHLIIQHQFGIKDVKSYFNSKNVGSEVVKKNGAYHAPQGFYQCSICYRNFETENLFSQHYRSHGMAFVTDCKIPLVN